MRTQGSVGAVGVDPSRKARGIQLPSSERVVQHARGVTLRNGTTAIRVGDRRVEVTANHHRLQTLAAHDRAKTRSRRLMMSVADDTREPHQVLPCRPNDRRVNLLSETVFEAFYRLRHGASPEVLGGDERGGPIVDQEDARDGGGTVNDEAIEAAALQSDAKGPLGPRLADPA
jgi:hypothetical protein